MRMSPAQGARQAVLKRPWDSALYKVLQTKGVVANGFSDDAGALQEALLSRLHGVGRTKILFPPDIELIRIDSGISIPFCNASVDWDGITLDAAGMTSGSALSLIGQGVVPYNIGSNVNAIRGLLLNLPNSDATAVDGISIGGVDSTFPGHGSIENVCVRGGRDGLVLGNNFFISKFDHLFLYGQHRYGIDYVGTTNTGESINFFGGGVLDTRNALGNAVGLYVSSAAAGPDLSFYGTSFSYGDIAFDVQCGATAFMACHFESETENPVGRINYVGGRPSTLVQLIGGSLSHGTLIAGTVENAAGRPVMFEINPAAGDRCAFIMRGVRYGGFGKKNTELVRFSGNGFVEVVVADMVTDAQGGNVGRVCEYINVLYNAGAEAHVSNGWTVSLGGATVSRDTAVFNTDAAGASGIASWKLVSAAANTTTYAQEVRGVAPGRKIRARGFMRCDSLSAGTLTLKLYLLDQSGAILTTYTVGTLSAANGGLWQLYGNDYRVTAGAVSGRFEWAGNGFTGTAYFDDMGVWVL